jgi:4-alpha-glucanotransferase
MTLHLYLKYNTRWGQELFVCGNAPEMGGGDRKKALALSYFNDQYWHVAVDIDTIKLEEPLSYYYFLTENGNKDIYDAEPNRRIEIEKGRKNPVSVFDDWNSTDQVANVFYSQPFSVLLSAGVKPVRNIKVPARYTHCFKVKMPLLAKDETVCICGSAAEMGNWNSEAPLLMQKDGDVYTVFVKLPKEAGTVFYKYGIYNTRTKTFVSFEAGDNRSLAYETAKNETVYVHDGLMRRGVAPWKGAGVAIPVFSLRSKKSFGTGEFADIALLVDWAAKTGLKLVQLLPVNDTTARKNNSDSYPYAAISAYAMHPLFLRLDDIGTLPEDHKLQQHFLRKQKKLNREDVVAYEDVIKFKLAYLKELYLLQKETLFADAEYIRFFEQNKDWLTPYAAFSCLRDRYKTPDFNTWKKHSQYNAAKIEQFCKPGTEQFDDIAVWYFIQYHLHLQLKKAVDYAHSKGIVLKGDIAIGIYRNSCDAWVEPELYNMDMQAGAPPDDFAVKGQNWGFPTYNWQRMQQDGFQWWKRRFEHLSNYFDAFRIDHILGFFRIWSVPMNAVEGIMGHFVPAIPVHADELHQRGVQFSADRYCKPYITHSLLWEYFGDRADAVKDTYLQAGGMSEYELKEEYNTQRKIEAHFSTKEKADTDAADKQALYDFVSNVMMFDAYGYNGAAFHFRIGMDKTYSFSQLDWHTQQQLKDLYVDYFYRRQDDFWQQEAMHKLPALKHTTDMLVCGEDLGMVPACVPDVMKQLSMLSLEVQRMPKETGVQFTNLNNVPWLSVATPSTHDMSTIRGWWEEDRAVTQNFYNHYLGHYGDAPAFCEPWVSAEMINQHLQSPSMWSIFQLQDLMGINGDIRRENPHEERINQPADPTHYWCYRMHVTLEDLNKHKAFNTQLKELVTGSGR